ncbi:MAG: hypothetical protein R8M45_04880, partial [Ghiorsea sp.]
APVKLPLVLGATPVVSNYSVSINGLGSTNVAWWHAVSWANPVAYTAAMNVSGGTIKGNLKRLTAARFFVESYNAAGVQQASTGVGTFTNPAPKGSASFTLAVATTKAITVPQSGYLVLRADVRGHTSRSKGSFVMGVSNGGGLVWNPTEVIAITGPTGSGTGSLTLAGSGVGSVETPAIRYYCASIRMADDTAAANGLTVHLHDVGGKQEASYLTGLTTTNHPAGHPTYTTAETGWVCFNHTALIADQLDHHITVLPQAGTSFEGGVSILVTPQTTNNGNG